MKKKLLRHEKKLDTVRLHLDEVKSILSAIDRLAGRVLLETREYEFSTLDELASVYKQPLKRLKITSIRHKNERITMDYTNERIVLSYQPEDSDELIGVAERIQKIIHQKLRFRWAEAAFEIAVSGLFVGIFHQALKLFTQSKDANVFTFIFGLIVALVVLPNLGKLYCRVVPIYKADEVSFFKKRGEDLFFYFCCTLIGALITFILVR